MFWPMGTLVISLFLLQSAGQASLANLDKVRYAEGQTSTADLRLQLQKVI